MSLFFLLLIVGGLCTLDGLAFEESESWKVERQEWRTPLGDATSVEFRNPWGEIRVKKGDRPECYLKVAVQRHEDDPRPWTLDMSSTDQGLVVEAKFTDNLEVMVPSSWDRRRMDAVLVLPSSLDLRLETLDGKIVIKGWKGALQLKSRDGDINLRTHGPVVAESRQGTLRTLFLGTQWATTSRFETSAGLIRVELPRGGSAEVELETRGELTSDYSLQINRPEGQSLKKARSRVGRSGPKLVLKSHQGAIKLLASLIPVSDHVPHPSGPSSS